MRRSDIAVLLINTGTPDNPSVGAVRRYLKDFLKDPRIVEMPRAFWLPILYGVVLPFRPAKSAVRYASIWTSEGSPLDVHMKALEAGLQERLGGREPRLLVRRAMCYSAPRLDEQIDRAVRDGVEQMLLLPLFPQYSPQTVGSVMDAAARYCLGRRNPPAVRTVKRFYDRPGWARAVAAQVRALWREKGPLPGLSGRLLLSFHGIPLECVEEKGDSYRRECEESAALIVRELGLADGAWEVSFQSRFGPHEWLRPYTFERLRALGGEGVSRVDVVCPSFATDCLETCEEINIEGRAAFLAGCPGGSFNYVPCINESEEALSFYASLIAEELKGWI
ncbi:ferrochelatase [Mesosutterella sp. AGMB02718]|uniref:Ferrochelatase n=1 Tax=Mesosutterella faecium TaxID=2925194 RepID=A0ABT7IKY6_9BURK|nr:ferrochelatase [Mesosutterella sp. AGMB02718]MDL2059037.1 ferrochelatase [Mesosutterella sp. AGMB02718]